MAVLIVLAVVLQAVLAAVIAEAKGHGPVVWLLIGLALPGVGLLILLVAVAPVADQDPVVPSATEAVRDSPVARELAARPGSSAQELRQRLDLPDREVVDQLRALRTLGVADRGTTGRWRLTGAGRAALAPDVDDSA